MWLRLPLSTDLSVKVSTFELAFVTLLLRIHAGVSPFYIEIYVDISIIRMYVPK